MEIQRENQMVSYVNGYHVVIQKDKYGWGYTVTRGVMTWIGGAYKNENDAYKAAMSIVYGTEYNMNFDKDIF